MKKISFVVISFILLLGVVGCKNVVKNVTKKDYTSYIGVWRNGDSTTPDDELIIKSIDGNEITFDYIVYRTSSFENEVATLKGNVASFDIPNTIKGTIELKNNKVTFKVTKSSFDYIEVGSTTYTTNYEKSLLKGE